MQGNADLGGVELRDEDNTSNLIIVPQLSYTTKTLSYSRIAFCLIYSIAIESGQRCNNLERKVGVVDSTDIPHRICNPNPTPLGYSSPIREFNPNNGQKSKILRCCPFKSAGDSSHQQTTKVASLTAHQQHLGDEHRTEVLGEEVLAFRPSS